MGYRVGLGKDEKEMVRQAVITAKVMRFGKPLTKGHHANGKPIRVEHTVHCSTDLPADAMAEAAVNALNRAWKAGVDPVLDAVTVVMSFSMAPIPPEEKK